uniref:uncharacterized protein LOC100181319 isoform X2 n=1 Tax=Ciona intestinalis TaxID=7719 RepID=UPI000EF470B6|nr:uncharacterized protein LOC100181319 isoform X2 [Ciona intestinalis]|eukprot:XP_026693316.1 uncharacterized protein LOC100181319 isoform X2 [Ciona intestinalis]
MTIQYKSSDTQPKYILHLTDLNWPKYAPLSIRQLYPEKRSEQIHCELAELGNQANSNPPDLDVAFEANSATSDSMESLSVVEDSGNASGLEVEEQDEEIPCHKDVESVGIALFLAIESNETLEDMETLANNDSGISAEPDNLQGDTFPREETGREEMNSSTL